MTLFTIRPAADDDADFLPDIERSAGKAFLQIAGLEWIADDEVMSAEIHQIYIDEGTVWIAESEGQPIGFITTAIFGPDDGDTLHILELAVADGYQGQGIGGRLMDTAREYAAANSFKALTLTTFRDLAFNENFYRRLGYKTLGDDELSTRLADTLKAESENGLPAERRCAMRMEILAV